MQRLALSALALLVLLPVASAADWPQWRGPLGNGTSPDGDPPVTWSEEENVRFKVAVPGRGLASPVVWGEQIFLLTAEAADPAAYEASRKAAAEVLERKEWPPAVRPVRQRFLVLALSRDDGRVVWKRTAREHVPHESHYIDSSWASASPVTDGERLFAFFGSNGLFAYDLTGKLLWEKDLGDMKTRNGHGEGSSPALYGDLLLVNWDHEDDSFVVALDKKTGAERWRTERPGEVTSWATPVVVRNGDSAHVIVPASGQSRGYDLATGAELWRLGGMTDNVIPTPVERDGLVYLTSGKRGAMLQAVAVAKARGDLEGSDAVAWSYDRHTPYVPSILLYDDRLYFLKQNKNILTCLDAATGEVVIPETRLEGVTSVWASPVGAAGRVYVVDRDGTTLVLAAGDEYRVLASNHLDDRFDASPAVVGKDLYLRGRHHLYALSAE